MRHGRVRMIAGSCLLVAILALTGLAVRLSIGRIDPRSIPQKRLYDLGTASNSARMAPLPAPRRVVVQPVTGPEVLAAARAYLSMRATPRERVQSYYDPATRTIHIVGVLPRLEASTDAEWAQRHFRRSLRHEYGHAFIDDWTRTQRFGAARRLDYSVDRESARPADFPPRLRSVVGEYAHSSAFVFGYDYYTSSLAEYLAEGYARYLEGQVVPPRLRSFLGSAAQPR